MNALELCDATSEGFWDRTGTLSIVVQGPLSEDDVNAVAVRCRHWREIFPACELIFSASATDFEIGGPAKIDITPARGRSSSLIQSALEVMRVACDKIVLAKQDALPLAPIAGDVGPDNNVNLQIRTAQAGMIAASGTYTLRVRSDFVFLDRSFIDHYIKSQDARRGDLTIFTNRVMISWLFTLNPYTDQRQPFHFSDWFNFGLTVDIMALWDCPLMSFADSVRYRIANPPPGENFVERHFYMTLAIEQHIVSHWASRNCDDFSLSARTDCTSRELSVDVLVDNFILCDLAEAAVYFPKYQSMFRHPDKRTQCITVDDWEEMIPLNGEARYKVLSSKASPDYWLQPRTYRYPVETLATEHGVKAYNSIINATPTCILSYGPYATLYRGEYSASISVGSISSEGAVIIRVLARSGALDLCHQIFNLPHSSDVFEVTFTVMDPFLERAEVLCEIQDVEVLEILGLEIKYLKQIELV